MLRWIRDYRASGFQDHQEKVQFPLLVHWVRRMGLTVIWKTFQHQALNLLTLRWAENAVYQKPCFLSTDTGLQSATCFSPVWFAATVDASRADNWPVWLATPMPSWSRRSRGKDGMAALCGLGMRVPLGKVLIIFQLCKWENHISTFVLCSKRNISIWKKES